MTETGGVPVLDLAGFGTERVSVEPAIIKEFGRALEEVGFLAITNHGIPDALGARLYDLAKRFFAEPETRKRACSLPTRAKPYGYLSMGIESVAATLNGEEAPDLCEALVFVAPNAREPEDGRPANLWPEEPPELPAAVVGYYRAVAALAHNLYRLAALALGLPEDYFAAFFLKPSFVLRLVNYPDQPIRPRPGQLRYGAHHDYGGLTILRQDDAPGGLEVCDRAGQWHAVPPLPGAFVLNVGDLLARWTNDRWRSTLHRVINPPRYLTGSTQRLSIVLFSGPDAAAEIGVLPSCVDAEHPARYTPVKAGEYISAKIAASHDLKKTTKA